MRKKGLGETKKTAIFPKLVFAIDDGVNKDPQDPNYDIKQLALETASLRMYPDIVYVPRIREMTGGKFLYPMGCRNFLSAWKNEDGEYVTDGRANMGVVTLNLPRISLETDSEEEFFELLDERMLTVKDALDMRIRSVMSAKPYNAPIIYKYGATGIRLKDDDSVKPTFDKGRASIACGFIGIYEATAKFYGKDWYDNPKAMKFSEGILARMKETVDSWKENSEDGWGYSLYGTPAESLCHTFADYDREKFGVVENVTDKDYYTNSFHVDPRNKMTPTKKLDIESNFAPYSTGGFIHYVETPSLKNNLGALEELWDYACETVGYFGVNSPIDECHECGFHGEFLELDDSYECPRCGNSDPETCTVTKRICGYLGNPLDRPVNTGKFTEFKDRVKHV